MTEWKSVFQRSITGGHMHSLAKSLVLYRNVEKEWDAEEKKEREKERQV